MGERVYDVAIVGGGIVGLATAMALVRAGVRAIVVLEAEDRLAAHQTGHNSGVIHSGLYYKPGSLKARNCVAGREALTRFCSEHGIAHEACGKLVVATRESERPALAALEEKGRANGLRRLRRLAREELKELEPAVDGLAGLWVGETGIVDYERVCAEYARVVSAGGGEIRLGFAVHGCHRDGSELRLSSPAGEVRCRGLVNCAGLQSDRVARSCGVRPGLQIVPFRGEYYELAAARRALVRNLIYPVPDPRFPFLGVHFTRRINGGVEAGPNAVLAFARHGYDKTAFSLRDTARMAATPGFWIMGLKYWRMGLGEFHRSASKKAFVRALQRLLPAIRPDDLAPGGAGVRAQALDPRGRLLDDFCIQEAERMVHVLNAPSPAATASISIGEAIAAVARRNLSLDPRGRP